MDIADIINTEYEQLSIGFKTSWELQDKGGLFSKSNVTILGIYTSFPYQYVKDFKPSYHLDFKPSYTDGSCDSF